MQAYEDELHFVHLNLRIGKNNLDQIFSIHLFCYINLGTDNGMMVCVDVFIILFRHLSPIYLNREYTQSGLFNIFCGQ